jgi:hypothetical protein
MSIHLVIGRHDISRFPALALPLTAVTSAWALSGKRLFERDIPRFARTVTDGHTYCF